MMHIIASAAWTAIGLGKYFAADPTQMGWQSCLVAVVEMAVGAMIGVRRFRVAGHLTGLVVLAALMVHSICYPAACSVCVPFVTTSGPTRALVVSGVAALTLASSLSVRHHDSRAVGGRIGTTSYCRAPILAAGIGISLLVLGVEQSRRKPH